PPQRLLPAAGGSQFAAVLQLCFERTPQRLQFVRKLTPGANTRPVDRAADLRGTEGARRSVQLVECEERIVPFETAGFECAARHVRGCLDELFIRDRDEAVAAELLPSSHQPPIAGVDVSEQGDVAGVRRIVAELV